VRDLNFELCQAYIIAFLQLMQERKALDDGVLLIGYDLRPSSPQIARYVTSAARRFGISVENCGLLPTPALALAAISRRLPAIMITGSHIPADRNGLKFYSPRGEIDKDDEQAILYHLEHFPKTASHFLDKKCGKKQTVETQISDSIQSHSALASQAAVAAYKARAKSILPDGALRGLRIGIYQHSCVGRNLLGDVLAALGAQIVPFGRSDHFLAIDTEALDENTTALTLQAAREHQLDAIVSTDGDGDRPLIAGQDGIYLRGDIIGLLCARFLHADCVVTPITSSSNIEACGFFKQIYRCRVGSPYVLAEMVRAKSQGFKTIVGFEANGGVLLGSDVILPHDTSLPALATRDALLPILALLGLAKRQNMPVQALVQQLPPRFTASDRLEHVEPQITAQFLESLAQETKRLEQFPKSVQRFVDKKCGKNKKLRRRLSDFIKSRSALSDFVATFGAIHAQDQIDGLRFILANGDILHFRASGNAPELRCYSESSTVIAAQTLVRQGIEYARAHIEQNAIR